MVSSICLYKCWIYILVVLQIFHFDLCVYSLEGNSAYEVRAMSSFINEFVTALREGGSYKIVFERVQESKSRVLCQSCV